MSKSSPSKNNFTAKISYRGRQTFRADGMEKRKLILEASLRIIVRDGVRGVRHRAVAKEAGASLSSTTYYFNDIHDLIADSFSYYVECSIARNQAFEDSSLEILRPFLVPPVNKAQLQTVLCKTLFHIIKKQTSDIETRTLEWAFCHAALLDPKLQETVQIHNEARLKNAETIFIAIGSTTAETDAFQLIALIQNLEFCVMTMPESYTDNRLKQMLETIFTKTLNSIP